MEESCERESPRTPGRIAFREWAILSAGLCLFFSLVFASSIRKSPISDAQVHLEYGDWILGAPWKKEDSENRWDAVGPVTAIHVLSARLIPFTEPSNAEKTSPDTIPNHRWARLPSMLMGTILLALIWLTTRRFFGKLPATCALFIGALEPNLIGHSRFIATDLATALGFCAACLALLWYLERPGWTRLALLALVLALAQLAKPTNLILYPVAVAVIAGRRLWLRRRAHGLSGGQLLREAGALLATAAIFGSVLLVVIHCAFLGMDPKRNKGVEEDEISRLVTQELAGPLWSLRPLVPPVYSSGLALARAHNAIGHPAYLMGERSLTGWVTYFPIAIGVKTPLPILALALLGLLVFGWRRPAAFSLMLLPAVVLLCFLCFAARVNIGVRHALSVYPALVICAGLGLAGIVQSLIRTRRILPVLLVAAFPIWIIHQAVIVYPNYAQYFNEIAGGPENGWRFLLDSNVDWNQDVRTMQEWARSQERPVTVNPVQPTRGLIVIQAALLIGNNKHIAEMSAWLRENHRPVEQLTPAVFIYDVP